MREGKQIEKTQKNTKNNTKTQKKKHKNTKTQKHENAKTRKRKNARGMICGAHQGNCSILLSAALSKYLKHSWYSPHHNIQVFAGFPDFGCVCVGVASQNKAGVQLEMCVHWLLIRIIGHKEQRGEV
jgi:hypothetical protein